MSSRGLTAYDAAILDALDFHRNIRTATYSHFAATESEPSIARAAQAALQASDAFEALKMSGASSDAHIAEAQLAVQQRRFGEAVRRQPLPSSSPWAPHMRRAPQSCDACGREDSSSNPATPQTRAKKSRVLHRSVSSTSTAGVRVWNRDSSRAASASQPCLLGSQPRRLPPLLIDSANSKRLALTPETPLRVLARARRMQQQGDGVRFLPLTTSPLQQSATGDSLICSSSSSGSATQRSSSRRPVTAALARKLHFRTSLYM